MDVFVFAMRLLLSVSGNSIICIQFPTKSIGVVHHHTIPFTFTKSNYFSVSHTFDFSFSSPHDFSICGSFRFPHLGAYGCHTGILHHHLRRCALLCSSSLFQPLLTSLLPLVGTGASSTSGDGGKATSANFQTPAGEYIIKLLSCYES